MPPKDEKTLVIIKPDGVQRSLIGEIIKRLERSGLKLIAVKMIVPAPELIEKHYLADANWKIITGQKSIDAYKKRGKIPPSDNPLEVIERVLKNLKHYMSAGPVVAMVWQGLCAVDIVRKIIGGTEPLISDVGTIRGDFSIDSYEIADIDGRAVRNLVHASSSVPDAQKEICLWFKPEEIFHYRLIQEAILYDVNLDGILE
jgi:nucleoside-diphosphate kinase